MSSKPVHKLIGWRPQPYEQQIGGDDANYWTEHGAGHLNVFEKIPANYRAGIEAHTSSVDVRGWIQDALDEEKSGLTNYTQGGRLVLPAGRYNLGAPLTTYSGLEVGGAGMSTRLVATAGFSGAHLLTAAATPGGTRPYVETLYIHDLGFVAEGSVWALDVAPLQTTISRLHFWTHYGLKFYGQGSLIEDLRNWGETGMNQMLWYAGNYNTIRNIDKANGTGTTTEPYVKIAQHPGGGGVSATIVIEGIVLQNALSANKAGIEIDGAQDVTVRNVWLEGSPLLVPGMHVYGGARDINIEGTVKYLIGVQKLKVSGGSEVTVDFLSSDADDVPLHSILDVDATSRVVARSSQDRRGAGRFRVDDTSLVVRGGMAHAAADTTATTQISPWSEHHPIVHADVLPNGSFEQGMNGWEVFAAPTTQEFIQSAIGPGLMGHWVFNGNGSPLVKSITVPAAWVGRPMVFGGAVDVGAAGSWPIVSGCGVDSATSGLRFGVGAWESFAVAFKPLSAGTRTVGVNFGGGDASTHYYADNFYLGFGTIGRGMSPHTKEINLGGITIVAGTGAPTSGTWKVGDRVLGTGQEWVCTVAGSPGTWAVRQWTQAEAQGDSAAADVATLKTDFNALLAKLRAAGVIAI